MGIAHRLRSLSVPSVAAGAIVGIIAVATAGVFAGVGADAPSITAPTCASSGTAVGCTALHVVAPTHRHGSRPLATATPTSSGTQPSQLQAAYGVTGAGAGQAGNSALVSTVGIVDAYASPNVVSDVAAYRSEYGLPACNTTTQQGCVTVYNQSGTNISTAPVVSSGRRSYTVGGVPVSTTSLGWDVETALDVDSISALCPYCHIVLVEANSSSFSDLGTAEVQAAKLAPVVDNSWGGAESSSDTSYDTSYFNTPGVVYTASTGDSGYGVIYPSSSPRVVAVAGTSLNTATNVQTVWTGSGAGCSAVEATPSWQTAYVNTAASTHTPAVLCGSKRAVADIALDADPNTGIWIYDTDSYDTSYGTGWSGLWGGTSMSTQLAGALYGLASNAAAITGSGTGTAAGALYAHAAAMNDVTSGIDAASTASTNGVVTSGSTSITSVKSTSGIAVGYGISGAGIPAGATVTAVTAATRSVAGKLTISSAATASSGTGGETLTVPSCPARLCVAGPGWDLPSGLGAPNGLSGF